MRRFRLGRAAWGRLLGAVAAGALAVAVASASRPEQAGVVVVVGAGGLAAVVAAVTAGRADLVGIGVGAVGVALMVGQATVNAGLAVEAAGLLVLAELAWWATERRPEVAAATGTDSPRWAYLAGLAGGALLLGLVAWGAGQAGRLGLVALAAGTVAAVSAMSIVWSLALPARR